MAQNFSPAELSQRDGERMRGYKALLDFYEGHQWCARPSVEKRLTFNYARVVIDKLTSYLMGGMRVRAISSVGASGRTPAGGDGEAARAQAALDRISHDNNLQQLDFDTELDCAVLGDGAYKVIWDSETGEIRVTSPDVQGLYGWWRTDDVSRLCKVASRYSLPSVDAQTLYGVKTRGKSCLVTEVWTDETFELWCDNALVERKPNPCGAIPFIIFPNLRQPKRCWGMSDIPQLMEPQRELNRALSQLSHILELSGNPIAVLENVEQSEDIAVRPGAVWNLPEEAKAYLLDLLQGGGVGLHISYIEMLYRTLHDMAESPRAAFGGTGRDISGVALEIELQPLLQKIWRKRLIREPVYRRRAEMILRLLSKYKGEDYENLNIEVVWAPVLPRDIASVVKSEETLVQSGIHSRRRAMAEVGVTDPESEFARWLDERSAILKMNKEMNVRPKPGTE
ncbi:MAG: phage portal protein [Dehalococcoidia bacterium]|nr:MAG: phage portal protein [Dehalococcoidia bacterium]